MYRQPPKPSWSLQGHRYVTNAANGHGDAMMARHPRSRSNLGRPTVVFARGCLSIRPPLHTNRITTSTFLSARASKSGDSTSDPSSEILCMYRLSVVNPPWAVTTTICAPLRFFGIRRLVSVWKPKLSSVGWSRLRMVSKVPTASGLSEAEIQANLLPSCLAGVAFAASNHVKEGAVHLRLVGLT